MNDDDELCLCFHVTKRKVLQYLRVERPQRAGQLSECFGAGTGCGWCRPFLKALFEAMQEGRLNDVALPNADQYASHRAEYRKRPPEEPPS